MIVSYMCMDVFLMVGTTLIKVALFVRVCKIWEWKKLIRFVACSAMESLYSTMDNLGFEL